VDQLRVALGHREGRLSNACPENSDLDGDLAGVLVGTDLAPAQLGDDPGRLSITAEERAEVVLMVFLPGDRARDLRTQRRFVRSLLEVGEVSASSVARAMCR